MLEELMTIETSVLGRDHPQTLATLNNYGVRLQDAGRFDESLSILQEAHELRAEVLGPSNPHTLASLANMAMTLRSLGRSEEALALVTKVVEVGSASLPPDHWWIVEWNHLLGRCYYDLGRFEEAEPLMIESSRKLGDALGINHYRTRDTLESLAALYEAWGKLDKAAEYRAKLVPKNSDED
jgi:tetratricopeptide (TPR) repeat protein